MYLATVPSRHMVSAPRRNYVDEVLTRSSVKYKLQITETYDGPRGDAVD